MVLQEQILQLVFVKSHLLPLQIVGYMLILGCSCLQEVRRVWLGYMSQCDSTLGQKLAAKVQATGQM